MTTQTPQDQPFGNVSGERSEKPELKTSEEWAERLKSITILDPDGWDRKNFRYSWHEELITEKEFNYRLMQSTISGPLWPGEKKAALALSSADSSGSDNVPQPKGSGEQPTSVEGFESILDHWLVPLKEGKTSVTVAKTWLNAAVKEERRQAKIAILEHILEVDSYFPNRVIHDLLTELKEGENNGTNRS